MLIAWAFTLLTIVPGLGLGAVAGIGVAIAAVWARVGDYLGRICHRDAAADDAVKQ
jgi:hypothetical protein